MKTLVIIPTYNEKENITSLVSNILHEAPEVHVLIVDDNSPDGTGKLADELCQKYPSKVFVLHRSQKDGLGSAYREGFVWALAKDYHTIITMDADWSHNPTDIPRLLRELEDYDFVIGSRYLGGIRILNWPLSRLIISVCANRYIRLVTGLPLSDTTSGFMCFSREALRLMCPSTITAKGYASLIEMKYRVWKSGYKLKEIPIIFSQRRSGTPKMSVNIILEALWVIWLFRFHTPQNP